MTLKRIEDLENEISRLEEKVKEIKAALPAHSINPHMLQEIEDLEEELNIKRIRLKQIRSSS